MFVISIYDHLSYVYTEKSVHNSVCIKDTYLCRILIDSEYFLDCLENQTNKQTRGRHAHS